MGIRQRLGLSLVATVASAAVSTRASALSCDANGGIHPVKAALAVAMAREMGRLDPARDLAVANGMVVLSPEGRLHCRHDCAETRGILDKQVGRSDRNPVAPNAFRDDLVRSFECQKSQAAAEAVRHEVKPVASSVHLDPSSCGTHNVFQIDDLSGQPLDARQAAALESSLAFFGTGACGNNPYLGFTVTSVSCPAGRTCIAIDPDPNDQGGGSSTCSGSAPTYPDDRSWDPNGQLLSDACARSCATTEGFVGSMTSFCGTVPSSCGYDYCVPFGRSLMIRADVNGTRYGLNAYGGVYEYRDGASWRHTPVTLHSQCWNNNPDCLWIYRPDRMIVSVRDQTFAINAWGGAGQDVALVLTRFCAPNNPDCTWSFVDGNFVNDRNPSLKFAAPSGGYDGSPIKLRSDQSLAWALTYE